MWFKDRQITGFYGQLFRQSMSTMKSPRDPVSRPEVETDRGRHWNSTSGLHTNVPGRPFVHTKT